MLAAKKSCPGFLLIVVIKLLQVNLVFGNTIDVLKEEHRDFGWDLNDEEGAVKCCADKKYKTLKKRLERRWPGLDWPQHQKFSFLCCTILALQFTPL